MLDLTTIWSKFPFNFGRPRWRSLSPENFPLTSSFRLFLVSVFSISAELLPLSLTFASSPRRLNPRHYHAPRISNLPRHFSGAPRAPRTILNTKRQFAEQNLMSRYYCRWLRASGSDQRDVDISGFYQTFHDMEIDYNNIIIIHSKVVE